MMRPVTVSVYDVVGGSLCVSADDGRRLHDKILPLLRQGTLVVLSFERVELMISAFLNAAIGQLYGELSYESVDDLLSATDLSSDDVDVWQQVIENAKVYFERPEDLDRAWREEIGDDDEDYEDADDEEYRSQTVSL